MVFHHLPSICPLTRPRPTGKSSSRLAPLPSPATPSPSLIQRFSERPPAVYWVLFSMQGGNQIGPNPTLGGSGVGVTALSIFVACAG